MRIRQAPELQLSPAKLRELVSPKGDDSPSEQEPSNVHPEELASTQRNAMSIDPLHSGRTSRPDAARLDGNQAARRSGATQGLETTAADQTTSASGDRVELSGASLDLVNRTQGNAEIPQGSIPTERMKAMLQRLEGGFYDSEETRAATAERLLNEL